MILAAEIRPAPSALRGWYEAHLAEAHGDAYDAMTYAAARHIIVSSPRPKDWRHVGLDLLQVVAAALEDCAGWPARRARAAARLIVARGELWALDAWEDVA